MSRYADPNSCPNCRKPAYGEQRCAACGLLLLGPTPQRLLSALTDADRILDGLRVEAQGWRRANPLAPAGGLPAAPGPRPVALRQSGSSWSTGSTLLALGALCLIVAGAIFVSVSWGSLGIAGRTAVLGAVTLLVGGAATAVTVRRLRASAEALWAVALAMLALDYAGAYSYGLMGLDALSAEAALIVFGAVLAPVGAAVTVSARRTHGLSVTAGEVGTCVGLMAALAGAVSASPLGATWTVLALVLPVGAVAAGARAVRLEIVTGLAACTAGLLHGAGALSAASDTLAYNTVVALFTGHGVLLTLAAAGQTAALGVGSHTFVRRRGDADLAGLVASATTAIVAGQLLVLVYAPALDDGRPVQLVAAIVLVALAAAGILTRGTWLRGIRVTALLSAVPVAWFAAAWCAVALASVVRSASPVWSAGVWVEVRPVDAGLGSAWLAGLALGGLAISVVAGAYYSDIAAGSARRRTLQLVAAGLGAVGLVVLMCLLGTPVVLVAAAMIGIGVVSAAASRTGLQVFGLALVVAAAPIALVSQAASLVVWCLVSIAAAGIAFRTAATVVRSGAVAVSVVFAQLSLICAVHLAGADGRIVHLSLVLAAVGTLIAAQYARLADVRLAAESVAYAGVGTAVVAGVLLSPGWQSAMVTLLGAALTSVSLLRTDRRMLSVPGALLLGVGYVVRLVASDVGVVEAYTLPFAVVLLVVGCVRLRAVRSLRTRVALSPGLSLALLPTLPPVLVDPTTLRGLLLGVAALAVLGAGARLRWQAPFAAGVALAAVIVVRHLGPYADAVPRWALIAAAGATMLVVGVTWESRVRDARAAASYVDAMR